MPKLYLISPETIPDVDSFLLQLTEICELESRPSLFQLRIKNASLLEIEFVLEKVKLVCEKYGVEVILNDNIALALKHNVGVHIGSSDASLQELEHFKKHSNKIAGVSCYNSIERAKMFQATADYISFGAMFQSSTKKTAPVCEKSTIVEFAKNSNITTFNAKIAIIGGITAENMAEISDILPLVDCVCVISEVWGGDSSQMILDKSF